MMRQHGMTLVELLVAVIITVIIAASATLAISRMLDAGKASRIRERLRAKAELAAERIATDLAGVVRDGDLYHVRILVVDGTAGGATADELLLFARSPTPARAGGRAEGGAYEIQYRLAGLVEGVGGRPRWRPGDGPGVLWRRIDPVPDDAPDGGGVVQPIVEGLVALSIEAFDGEAWRSTWDSDLEGVPHAVRVVLTAQDAGGRTAVTRRAVAMDRVPLPYVFLAPEERDEEDETEGDGS